MWRSRLSSGFGIMHAVSLRFKIGNEFGQRMPRLVVFNIVYILSMYQDCIRYVCMHVVQSIIEVVGRYANDKNRMFFVYAFLQCTKFRSITSIY